MFNRHLTPDTLERLWCPACRSPLARGEDRLVCARPACGCEYPVVDGIPVLVNDATSVFSIQDFLDRRTTTLSLDASPMRKVLLRLLDLLPAIGVSIGTPRHFGELRDALLGDSPAPKVLVVGGSIQGNGMEPLIHDGRIEIVATDVSFGPHTSLICDAHDIPFQDDTFDGVVVQAVLEHVIDPRRCVEEIHRVLKSGGLVYAETPFMQQVHLGRYDFTRFTHSGHRRLFRDFTEVASGPVAGPGTALAWSYQYFLLSFSVHPLWRGLLRAFAALTSFHLKYLDYFLIGKAGAIDAASGFFFLGRKSGSTLSDRDLVKYYRGAASR